MDSTEIAASVNDTIVAVPLTTEADLTSLLLTLNGSDEINKNTDIVSFTYDREEVYLNRACSFKMVYNNVLISISDDTDNWILDTEVINPVVENENEAHITIFH